MVFSFTYLSFKTLAMISSFVSGPCFAKRFLITSRTTPDAYPQSVRAYNPLPTRTNLESLISSL